MDEGPRNNYTLLDLLTTSSAFTSLTLLFLFDRFEEREGEENTKQKKNPTLIA